MTKRDYSAYDAAWWKSTTALIEAHRDEFESMMTEELGRPYTFVRQHPAECGTRSGYQAHLRRGERPCEGCRKAHRDAARKQYARSRGA